MSSPDIRVLVAISKGKGYRLGRRNQTDESNA
jgi:hypothetical protein